MISQFLQCTDVAHFCIICTIVLTCNHGRVLFILRDPGADSGDEEKSKRAEKYMARRKVKNGEKSPWGQCLTRPVPNSCRHSGF